MYRLIAQSIKSVIIDKKFDDKEEALDFFYKSIPEAYFIMKLYSPDKMIIADYSAMVRPARWEEHLTLDTLDKKERFAHG